MIRSLILVAAVGLSVALLTLGAAAWHGGQQAAPDLAAVQPASDADLQHRPDQGDLPAAVTSGKGLDARPPLVGTAYAPAAPRALPLGGVADGLPLALALGLAAAALTGVAAILASFRATPARNRTSGLA
jgi:hypothetical protein